MKKVLILGSTGMLGYGVISSLSKYKNLKLSATARSKKKIDKISSKFPYNKISKFITFDVLKKSDSQLKKITSNFDYIINCIGVIKPEINSLDNGSLKKAIYINSIFPLILAREVKESTTIYQIATDCVFSGSIGRYNEKSVHDDIDIYGVSKSLGEIKKKNFFNLRTSIIGKEFNTQKSLLEWFLGNKKKAVLKGFENHYWNGITTKAFGEIIYTLIDKNFKIPNTFHIIPKDVVNKYDLLKIFNDKFGTGFKIKKYKTQKKMDRSLKTIYVKKLKYLWKLSFFKSQPTIKKMIELI